MTATEVLNRALKTALAGKVGEPGDIQLVEGVPSCHLVRLIATNEP
jgi:hypothetical protein